MSNLIKFAFITSQISSRVCSTPYISRYYPNLIYWIKSGAVPIMFLILVAGSTNLRFSLTWFTVNIDKAFHFMTWSMTAILKRKDFFLQRFISLVFILQIESNHLESDLQVVLKVFKSLWHQWGTWLENGTIKTFQTNNILQDYKLFKSKFHTSL